MRIGKITTIVIQMALLTACSTTKVIYDGPCPSRPQLMALPVDLQIQMPPDAVWIVAENQLALKQHIIDLEDLSGCAR